MQTNTSFSHSEFVTSSGAGTPASAHRYASGLRLRAPDLLKIGQLAEADGAWRGREIVSADWTKNALRSHVDDPVPEELRHRVLRGGYGYQWWNDEHVIPGGSIKMSYAQGNGGQKIFIVPEYDLVVVTLAGTYGEFYVGSRGPPTKDCRSHAVVIHSVGLVQEVAANDPLLTLITCTLRADRDVLDKYIIPAASIDPVIRI